MIKKNSGQSASMKERWRKNRAEMLAGAKLGSQAARRACLKRNPNHYRDLGKKGGLATARNRDQKAMESDE